MKRFFGIPVIIFLLSCGPEIDVHSPTDNQSYLTEATIYIKATITDNDGIKNVKYKHLVNEYTIDLPALPTTYELDESTTMTNLGGGSTTITISAEDAGGTVTIKNITVYNQQ
jgi:hypothetical protein